MIIFFYGKETFQPEQRICVIKKKFFAKNPTGSGLEEFLCTQACDISAIETAMSTQSLFAKEKLIVIKDFFGVTKPDVQKDLRDILVKSTQDVIILWETKTPRKNATLFTWLTKNADTVKSFEPREAGALRTWILASIARTGSAITKDALEELILFVGNDLHMLTQEIAKLTTYVGKKTITRDDVQKLVHSKVDANIFATIEALASGDKGHALALLRTQILAGDNIQKILAMYAYQLRILLSVSDYVEKQGITQKNVIAREAHMHPFVVEKALIAVQTLSHKRLLRAHTFLTDLDRDIKRGKRDGATGLEMFVMQM